MGWISDRSHAIKTFLFLVGSELMFLALFAGTVEFHPDLYSSNSTEGTPQSHLYPYWQDIHVMMYVGFGFLLVFPHAYSWGAVAFNMLMAAYGFQWCLLCNGFFWWIFKQNMHGYLELNIFELINADVGVASVLIAYSAILGKFSPLQYLFMTFCQIFLWSLNIYFCYFLYAAQDAGGAMVIHVFGAVFGLAVSWVNTTRVKKKPLGHPGWSSSYNSDTFAMIGTLFLWMFWPSFNSALAIEGGQNRAAINTALSIAASCLLAFAWSFLIRGKISMFDIQNATLAGGVAMGAACDLSLEPWGAILCGLVAGSVSALGYIYALPFLEKHLKLHDSAGIFNLHFMPGVIGGLASIFVSLSAQDDTIHGWPAGKIYLSRAPADPAQAAALGLTPGLGRSANMFAAYQTATLATSLGMGIIGGIGTGLIMRLPFCDSPHYDEYFLDRKYFEHHEDLDNQSVELGHA